jgi:hypothetical protein
MDFSDYEPRCAALGAASLAAATLADPKEAVARIRDRVIKPVWEATYNVAAEARVGEDPVKVRTALAKQVGQALAKTGLPAAREALAALKSRGAKEPGVVAACDEALAAMDAPPAAPQAPTLPDSGSE